MKKKLTGNLRDSVESKQRPAPLEHIKGCIFCVIKPGEFGYRVPWRTDCPACIGIADVENVDA
jgi:hypothetical protein